MHFSYYPWEKQETVQEKEEECGGVVIKKKKQLHFIISFFPKQVIFNYSKLQSLDSDPLGHI